MVRKWKEMRLTDPNQIVYTPPNVAKGGCNIFDPTTGKKSHVKKCGYYSAYGQLLKE